jgi:ParB family chromosome partitioning protein
MSTEAGPERAKTPPKLGRGLSALLGEMEQLPASAAPAAGNATGGVLEIAVARIHANPGQPRKDFPEAELAELAESVRTKGVLQPILVRPDPRQPGDYQIVAGERRWRAAQRAGLTALPALVRELDDMQVLEIAIIENVQRQDLNPIDEAEAYGHLMKRFGRTQEGLADSVGKSRVHIANTLRLLKLPEPARAMLRDGRVTAGHARAALAAPEPLAILQRVLDKGLSVRETEALARDAAAGKPEPARAAGAEKDIDTRALEADLARTLGLAVDIRQSARGGELRVRYTTLEQLDDLCARLSRKR